MKDCSVAHQGPLHRVHLEGDWYLGTYPLYFGESAHINQRQIQYQYIQHRHGDGTYNETYNVYHWLGTPLKRHDDAMCEKCRAKPPARVLGFFSLVKWER